MRAILFLSHLLAIHLGNQINRAGNAPDSHEIIYPALDRENKNHTLFSGTSPYRPYKGVPPPRPDWRGKITRLPIVF